MECEKMDGKKVNIELLLREGKTVQIFPQGFSMYPMLVPGRDEAVIAAVDTEKLHRGDVALYRRKSGLLVLHRIWKKKKDGFYMVGDHQTQIEGPIEPEQFVGVLVAFVRNGRRIDVKNPMYRAAAGLWLLLRPMRRAFMAAGAAVKKGMKIHGAG